VAQRQNRNRERAGAKETRTMQVQCRRVFSKVQDRLTSMLGLVNGKKHQFSMAKDYETPGSEAIVLD
jgi:hypothetical protein